MTDAKLTILVTGATGFIGNAFLRHTHHNILPFRYGNGCIPKCDVLIHLGCSINPRTRMSIAEYEISENTTNSIKLFQEFAKTNPTGHIIYASTGGNMYGGNSPKSGHTEESVPKPMSPYAIHKLTVEHHLRLICGEYQSSATILRISNPYGQIFPNSRAQGLIGVALGCLIENKPLTVFEPLVSIRDYLHINDLMKALDLAVLLNPKSSQFRLYHISSGTGHSIKEVLDTIETVTGRPLTTNISESSVQPTTSILCNKKVCQELGWTPTLNLQEGIQLVWDRAGDVAAAQR